MFGGLPLLSPPFRDAIRHSVRDSQCRDLLHVSYTTADIVLKIGSAGSILRESVVTVVSQVVSIAQK